MPFLGMDNQLIAQTHGCVPGKGGAWCLLGLKNGQWAKWMRNQMLDQWVTELRAEARNLALQVVIALHKL